MNKRLEMLEKLCAQASVDSFSRYALAMEYRKEGRVADALAAFEKLRAEDPDYVPMYLMAGQLLQGEDRAEEARTWLEAGVAVATRKGDLKAKNELVQALESSS